MFICCWHYDNGDMRSIILKFGNTHLNWCNVFLKIVYQEWIVNRVTKHFRSLNFEITQYYVIASFHATYTDCLYFFISLIFTAEQPETFVCSSEKFGLCYISSIYISRITKLAGWLAWSFFFIQENWKDKYYVHYLHG